MSTWLPACICWSGTIDSITASRTSFPVAFITVPMSPLFLCSHWHSSSVRYQSAEPVLIFHEEQKTSEHLHSAGEELLIGEINEVGYVWISSLDITREGSVPREARVLCSTLCLCGRSPVTRFSAACRRRHNVINGAWWEQWRGWCRKTCFKHLQHVTWTLQQDRRGVRTWEDAEWSFQKTEETEEVWCVCLHA